jgi:Zn-dependent protease
LLGRLSLLNIVVTIPAILIAFTFHEYAHAWVADRLGDKTPKFQGRLTLNPIVHVDIVGFIMILIAGFGWAKPIQTNPSAYKNYYRDDLKVSIAGPVANMTVAVIFSVITGVYLKYISGMSNIPEVLDIILMIFQQTIRINVILFFFNMLPLPGLDGFHVLRDLLPLKFHHFSDNLYRYQMLILVLFIATPLSRYIIGIPSKYVLDNLIRLIRLIAV